MIVFFKLSMMILVLDMRLINSHKPNTRSRFRMVTLYQIAASVGGIVIGTGNKVEDYGVGFYTKYGDGGIDIAPIADLYKTEVWELGESLGIDPRIVSAAPTDGLWDDGRTDTDQLGVSYELLEWVMESGVAEWMQGNPEELTQWQGNDLTSDQKEALISTESSIDKIVTRWILFPHIK